VSIQKQRKVGGKSWWDDQILWPNSFRLGKMPNETAAMRDDFTIRPKCKMPRTSSLHQSVSQSISQSIKRLAKWKYLAKLRLWDFGHRAGCRPNWNANADTKLLLKYFPNCLDSCDCYGYSISKQKRKEIVMISSASQLLRLYAFHSLHLAGCMNKTFKPS